MCTSDNVLNRSKVSSAATTNVLCLCRLQWNSLSETKKRVIKKAGDIFVSPKRFYEDMVRNRKHCVDRKLDVGTLNRAAQEKAAAVGGSTRVLVPNNDLVTAERVAGSDDVTSTTTSTSKSSTSSGSSTDAFPSVSSFSSISGPQPSTSSSATNATTTTNDVEDTNFVQALDSENNPLCLFCQGPITNTLCGTSMGSRDDVAWHTRFCRRECREEFLVKRAQTSYIR